MAVQIGMPRLNIVFTGLGSSAMERGTKGQSILFIKEEQDGEVVKVLKSIDAIDKEYEESISKRNLNYIKDVLKGTPKEVVVIRITEGESDEEVDPMFKPTNILEALKLASGKAEMNCWFAIADGTKEEEEDLISFIKSKNKNDKKRYKAVVFQADAPDSRFIVNFTTDQIKYKDEDEVKSGKVFIPRLLGKIAGFPLNMSLVSQSFGELEMVSEPEDKDEAIDNGEFILFNDEGKVSVGRGVNSLTTIGQGVTKDMRFILIVEVMDLIYTDIYRTWNDLYKGRYKNTLDYQMLFISAVNGYFETLEESSDALLDKNFDNRAYINTKAQKIANYPIYGEEEVDSWSEERILKMTVGTNIYPNASIKIPNAMEDLDMEIFM